MILPGVNEIYIWEQRKKKMKMSGLDNSEIEI